MTALSLAMILAESARRHPDTVAVVDGDIRVTYAELWLEARCYAAGLRELGIGPGDHVALLAPNVVDFPRVYYGVLAAGAVLVPVHLLLTPDEAAHVLSDSGAKLLVCHTSQLAMGAAAADRAGVPVATVGRAAGGGTDDTRLEDVSGSLPALPSYVTRSAEDVAVVLYTSGTTGVPKGAQLTHLNLVLNATVNVFDANDSRTDDVVLGCLPLFHSFGQTVAMNGTFRIGATLVLLARFTGPEAVDLMLREDVTVFHGVPTMYVALLAAARDRPVLPRLRLCVSGGASLPVAVLERFEAAFGTTVYEGYGLSETSPTATTNQPYFGTRPGSVGHPVWGVEVEIARADLDDRVELVPTGELGEIVIRGHNVFAGYLGRPEATAEALIDGWFRSGDLGRKDADGFVTIVDRKKDLIIRGGFNVYPREVEEALARHPAVGQVAVIGVPHPLHGEEVCAVVVPDPAATDVPGEQDLVDWAREHLGRHKYPRQVRYVDALPVGPSHKVLKRELRRTVVASGTD
ncbi:long-chain-fatty-acid--CoA ligase [Micromonospora endolithica]|uniref:Long-chain fatty acid--CoA ligase n=1 Tax=Micromonospora endolithica TaxID=230091 RepID=A0A3A9YV25_9ACTN|nr:long-chain fatty acid--CoA ligase [Micromonospora endolithica]RKN39629.1 long-chain fatty acid--CoA ligase [Micromonospora endolithica]TWJ22232.1 long-chain acyl-CoA synthetase [Micromonospora endolithica]